MERRVGGAWVGGGGGLCARRGGEGVGCGGCKQWKWFRGLEWVGLRLGGAGGISEGWAGGTSAVNP